MGKESVPKGLLGKPGNSVFAVVSVCVWYGEGEGNEVGGGKRMQRGTGYHKSGNRLPELLVTGYHSSGNRLLRLR